MVERYRGKTNSGKPYRFAKGHKRIPGSGRGKGTPNRVTQYFREAMVGATEYLGYPEPIMNRTGSSIIGWEPTSNGGTLGYLAWLGLTYPVAFSSFLGRILPVQINAIQQVEHTVKSKFSKIDTANMTLAQLMAAYNEAIGLTKPLAPAIADNSEDDVVEGELVEVTQSEDGTS